MKRSPAPTRTPAPLSRAEAGATEIGYIYTVLLSTLILSAVVVSMAEAVNRTHTANAEVEVSEVASRVMVSLEGVLGMVGQHPQMPFQTRVELPHHNIGYVVLGQNDRIKVQQTVLHGATVEMVIYNDEGIDITGRVLSSAPYLIIDYQPGSGVIQLRPPFAGG